MSQPSESTAASRILPAHIEGTVEAIAHLHDEHYQGSSPMQKLVDRMTTRAGRPGFVAALTVVVVGWMAVNLGLVAFGHKAWDDPPFFWMQGAIALAALYMTLLILVTQRREDQLASRREQLTLELAILGEQKSAKIIALLEELRIDLPMLKNRIDPEAMAMAIPSDPQAVFEAITDRSVTVGGSVTDVSQDTDAARQYDGERGHG